jgi:hypothetical protein
MFHGGVMKDVRKMIDRKKREVEDLIVVLLVKAKESDHHPNFPKADAFRKAAEFLQKGCGELYMATVALFPTEGD